MERKKSKLSKILITYDLIVEEKLSIQDNLDRVLSQVYSKAHRLKTSNENMKQRDVSDIQKYILDVLKQLCEVNSILDILIEDNPASGVVTPAAGPSNAVTFDLSTHIESPNVPVQATSETSVIPELPATTELENRDYNIQCLRQCLTEFTETVGLNQQNLSDMRDYYEKSSTSFNTVMPESPDSSVDEINHQYSETNFEIPEKDTNTTQEPTEPNSLHQFVSASDTSEDSAVSVGYNLKADHSESTSPLLSASEDSSICADMTVSPVNIVVKEEPQGFNNCTALEKLNNFRSEKVENVESSIAPDIKLKPSGSVIQNFIPPVQNKPTKKKDKKKKNEEKVFYALLPKETPKVGEECLISHIESPSEFYIHINDDPTVLIDEISEEINWFCEHNKKVDYISKEEALAEVGTFCLAFIESYKSWYRVEVIGGYKTDKQDEVLVRLVDFGNKKWTSFKYLRKMTEDMGSIPMLAIRCHFPLLYPPKSTHLNRLTRWPTSTIEAMLNISGIFCGEPNKTQYFKILYALLETNNSVAIDLYHADLGSEENTFGQVLIDMGLAVQLLDECHVQQ